MKVRLINFLFLSLIFLHCSDENIVNSVPGEEEEFKLHYNLNIKVDPRIELLSVVQHFTTWASTRHTKYDLVYKKEIDDYFKSFINHDAVKKSQTFTNIGFNYDAPPTLMLYHSAPPDLEQLYPYSDYLILRAGGEQNLTAFMSSLRDFAAKSNFMTFFDNHHSFYTKIGNDIKRNLADTNYIKILEQYYGASKSSYNIIPAPLFHAGGYGPQISFNGEEHIYNIAGPISYNNGVLSFGSIDNLRYLLLHEFGHSFVNPITNNHLSEINNSQALYEPIRTQMTGMAYSSWAVSVNEHLVRINVARMLGKLQGDGYKNQILTYENYIGFIYIYQLDTLMQRYESNRSLYPTYESFYPEIIALFNSLLTNSSKIVIKQTAISPAIYNQNNYK